MRICLVCGLIKESENCTECHEDETPPEGEALDFTE